MGMFFTTMLRVPTPFFSAHERSLSLLVGHTGKTTLAKNITSTLTIKNA
jgi:hypothetical protein